MEAISEIVNSLCSTTFTDAYNADCVSSSITVSGNLQSNSCYPYTNYIWWPSYWTTEDRTQKAFRVVKLLMEKKRLKLQTIEQFIKTVDEIVSVL